MVNYYSFFNLINYVVLGVIMLMIIFLGNLKGTESYILLNKRIHKSNRTRIRTLHE